MVTGDVAGRCVKGSGVYEESNRKVLITVANNFGLQVLHPLYLRIRFTVLNFNHFCITPILNVVYM